MSLFCSAVNTNGLCGTELEQKLSKLLKFGSKEESDQSPADPSSVALGEKYAAVILELAFFCVDNSFYGLARECLHRVPRHAVQKDSRLSIFREVLHIQLLVVGEAGPNKIYTKTAVEARVKAINQLEETLRCALRLSDPDAIQVGASCSCMYMLHACCM